MIGKAMVSNGRFKENKIQEEYGTEKWDSMNDEEKTSASLILALSYVREHYSHKSVWFMISETYGKYYINIYYDNEKNQANGEDL